MFNAIRRLLLTQILSIIYAIFTISIIEVVTRIPGVEILIIFDVILIGVISFFMSRTFLDNKWIDIALICIPYIIYCMLVFVAYSIISPIDIGENNYTLVFIILLGMIVCWVSIILSLVTYKWYVKQD
jgi:hypothetical protein